jgi:hypothetical protein
MWSEDITYHLLALEWRQGNAGASEVIFLKWMIEDRYISTREENNAYRDSFLLQKEGFIPCLKVAFIAASDSSQYLNTFAS